jgi:hypothetical protein
MCRTCLADRITAAAQVYETGSSAESDAPAQGILAAVRMLVAAEVDLNRLLAGTVADAREHGVSWENVGRAAVC